MVAPVGNKETFNKPLIVLASAVAGAEAARGDGDLLGTVAGDSGGAAGIFGRSLFSLGYPS